MWTDVQEELAASPRWIMDGDLGPYDALPPRLRRADTVFVLDFPLRLCAYRAARRGPGRLDFWWWVMTWRLLHRQPMLRMIAPHGSQAEVDFLRSQRQLEHVLSAATTGSIRKDGSTTIQ